ncbi:tyrosine-type recombinase/integrase [Photobacterium damselae]|uniref:tyrosine-type recombinase/integrase n=1 Tax=Photobacterium damselae TaxID=38293 RepID=UPI001EDF56EA|nr:tyrosine-type recombinase/integrase [Photobacterium damselae]MCG3812018.1 tyrosine-type recombinase/integrase [Photobacterium damselae]MCG3815576.1 tyrosine-type recombinase/integrase [Photobacterium damselae]
MQNLILRNNDLLAPNRSLIETEHNYASSISINPALAYIYSLAATDTSGGRVNAKYTLERFARFNLGPSFVKVDWQFLVKQPRLIQNLLHSFFIYRAKQKAEAKQLRHYSLKNLQVTPLINALLELSNCMFLNGEISECELKKWQNQLTNYVIEDIETPSEPSSSVEYRIDYSLSLSVRSQISLEAFSCFYIGSCIERMDWYQVLYAPVLQNLMQQFLSERNDRNLIKTGSYSPATADNLLRMLRGVAHHAWLSESITVETLERIKAIKLPRGSRQSSGRYLSYNELDKISAICLNQTNKIKGIRDNAIFWLMYESGLRRAEVVNLSLDDIDIDRGTIHVVGKGNKERYVPFSLESDLYQALSKWFDIRLKLRGNIFNSLFCVVNKHQQVIAKSLTTQSLNDLCKQIQRMGFERIVSPHDFRHSVATNLLRAGHDLLLVSKFMGHSSVTTTQRYDRRSDDDLKGLALRR